MCFQKEVFAKHIKKKKKHSSLEATKEGLWKGLIIKKEHASLEEIVFRLNPKPCNKGHLISPKSLQLCTWMFGDP